MGGCHSQDEYTALWTSGSEVREIASPFFVADGAMRESGEWGVVELGDGGVLALPPLRDPRDFYRALRQTAPWRGE